MLDYEILFSQFGCPLLHTKTKIRESLIINSEQPAWKGIHRGNQEENVCMYMYLTEHRLNQGFSMGFSVPLELMPLGTFCRDHKTEIMLSSTALSFDFLSEM